MTREIKTTLADDSKGLRGKCIFCGKTGVTKEHIWPEWIQTYVPATASKSVHTANFCRPDPVTGNFTTTDHHRKERPGDVVTRKLRRVCGSCNNGWMSALQQRAREFLAPIITGEQWRDITSDGGRTLAAWIMMFVMVLEFAHPKTVAITQDERTLFSQTLLPSADWLIWIGEYSGKKFQKEWWHRGYRLLSPDENIEASEICNTQVTTAAIGRLIIHAVSSSASYFMKGFDYITYGNSLGLRLLLPGDEMNIQRPARVFDDDNLYLVATYLNEMLAPGSTDGTIPFSVKNRVRAWVE